MTLFHLNFRDGIYSPDHEGIELPDLIAARKEAIVGLREIISENILKGRLSLKDYIEITDDTGVILCCVTFKDAVENASL